MFETSFSVENTEFSNEELEAQEMMKEFSKEELEAQEMMKEFSKEELEAQEMMKENEDAGEMLHESTQIELSQEIQNLSAEELRELAANEYAEHGSTDLRNALLELAETKDAVEGDSENSLGAGMYNGKTAKEWLAEEKIAEMEHNPSDARMARSNANKAAQYDI